MFEQAQNCLLPMGITSENVSNRFGVSRKEQDEAAVSWIYHFFNHVIGAKYPKGSNQRPSIRDLSPALLRPM